MPFFAGIAPSGEDREGQKKKFCGMKNEEALNHPLVREADQYFRGTGCGNLKTYKETAMTKGFGNLIRQAQQLQSKMMKVQEEMAGRTAEASAGGGMVIAVANGKQELVSIKIEKEVVNPEDVEMLQDLVVAAVNAALKKRPGNGFRRDEETDRRNQHSGNDVSGQMALSMPSPYPG